jgi:hypothetical protein
MVFPPSEEKNTPCGEFLGRYHDSSNFLNMETLLNGYFPPIGQILFPKRLLGMTLLQYSQSLPVLEPRVILQPDNTMFYPFHNVYKTYVAPILSQKADGPCVTHEKRLHPVSSTKEGSYGMAIQDRKMGGSPEGIKKQNKTIGSKRMKY